MNDIRSQLTFLGTGTGVPLAARGSPASVLRIPGATLLVDMGPGTLRQLSRCSLAVNDIDTILLTHLHPDHSADLIAFLFASRYPPYLRVRTPVHLLAGTEFESFFSALQEAYGHWIELPPECFHYTLLPQGRGWEQDFDHFKLTSRPVEHTASSLGYRLVLPGGKVLVFSGDSDYCTSLVELARQADWLICECSYPEGTKVSGHLTPSLAGRIAREAQVRHLILTHFYPECQGQDLIGPCARQFKGPITLAEDFLTLSI